MDNYCFMTNQAHPKCLFFYETTKRGHSDVMRLLEESYVLSCYTLGLANTRYQAGTLYLAFFFLFLKHIGQWVTRKNTRSPPVSLHTFLEQTFCTKHWWEIMITTEYPVFCSGLSKTIRKVQETVHFPTVQTTTNNRKTPNRVLNYLA